MSRSSVVDSVRDRLLNRKRETSENYEALLVRYALERLLYRLGQSNLSDQFVLKEAYAFLIWQGDMHRPTRDLDLLSYGPPEQLEEVFRQLCEMHEVPEDGVRFDEESVEASPIRDADEYGGMRTKIDVTLGSAELRLQIDVGFGDVVKPSPEKTQFPSLLDFPPPEVRAYPRPTVVAEKLHGLVTLGIANTRMKDFYDLWYLSRTFAFKGSVLVEAIQSTFQRRETTVPFSRPQALTEAFAKDEGLSPAGPSGGLDDPCSLHVKEHPPNPLWLGSPESLFREEAPPIHRGEKSKSPDALPSRVALRTVQAHLGAPVVHRPECRSPAREFASHVAETEDVIEAHRLCGATPYA